MLDPFLSSLVLAAIVIFVYMTLWFVIALVTRRNDVADIAWGLGFVTTSVIALVWNQNGSMTALLSVWLVLVWGVRLSTHIARRNIRKPEDYRYKAWRDSWGKWFYVRSYVQVFLLQGVLMLIIVSPVLLITTYATSGVSVTLVLGILIWLIGFVFESIGDRQLRQFIANPKNKGHIMKSGLWQYTRHPNYFGEVTQWWGIGVIALGCSYGLVGLIGPFVITLLILKVSGVPMLETKYKGNAEYEAYKKRTSVLIPLPPRD